MKELKKYQIIEINWIDSTSTSGWKSSIECLGEPQIEHKSVGYILQETKKSITIFQSMSEYKLEDGGVNIDAILSIPKVAITSKKFLK